MSEEVGKMFTKEELASQSKLNAYAFVVVSIAYVKKNNLSLEDYVKFIGNTFAPGWIENKNKPVKDVARLLALNFVSAGGLLETFSGDENKADFTIGGLPNKEWLFFDLDISQSEYDTIFNVSIPIMQSLDITFTWERQGESIKMTLTH
jgi:hypothetical protein